MAPLGEWLPLATLLYEHFVLPVSIDRNFSLECGLSSEAVPSQWHLPGKKCLTSSIFIFQCQVNVKFILRINLWRLFRGPPAISTKGCLCKGFFFLIQSPFHVSLEIWYLWSWPKTEPEIQFDTELLLICCYPTWALTKEAENEDMRKIKGPPITSQELIFFFFFFFTSRKAIMKCEGREATHSLSYWNIVLRTTSLR